MDKQRHDCWRRGWATCTACDGRIHQQGCTSRRDPVKDCCKVRHQRLHDSGQVDGLIDSSVKMLKG